MRGGGHLPTILIVMLHGDAKPPYVGQMWALVALGIDGTS